MIALFWPLLLNLAIGLILVYSYLLYYSTQDNNSGIVALSFSIMNYFSIWFLFSNSQVFIFDNVKHFFFPSDAHYGIDQQHCQSSWGVCVFGGVGKCNHEGNDLYMNMKKDYFHQR